MIPVPVVRTFKLILFAQVFTAIAEILGPVGPNTPSLRATNTTNSSDPMGTDNKIFPDKQKYTLFKRIRIPRGSSMSLTAQVSRPRILPENFIVNGDAIIVDAVVELPMWMDLDRFVDAMYHQDGGAREGGIDSIIGKERCFLYEKLESLLSSLLHVPPKTASQCLQRAICEVHEISTYYPSYAPSLGFELIQLFLSPSFGSSDLECYKPYVGAESLGKAQKCEKFRTKCHLNIAALLVKHFVNDDQFSFKVMES